MWPEHTWRSDPRTRGLADALLAGLDLDGRSARCPVASDGGWPWPRLLVDDPDLLAARRADQPPRRRGRRLARRVTWRPPRAPWSRSRTTGGSSTRSARRPGRSPTAQVNAYDGGYAAYVLAKAEREQAGRGVRGPPAEPAPQGAGLAAARTAGTYVEAAVPHRRGQRPHRRRAAAARHRRAAAASPAPGWGRTVFDVEDVSLRAGGRARCSTT